jgi:hypothetical protein
MVHRRQYGPGSNTATSSTITVGNSRPHVATSATTASTRTATVHLIARLIHQPCQARRCNDRMAGGSSWLADGVKVATYRTSSEGEAGNASALSVTITMEPLPACRLTQ